jgi:hypothetical protein
MELYADRLSRHAERLRDDVAGARMRIAWARFEAAARARLGEAEVAVLEAVGALAGGDERAERRLLRRRLRQLEAVERLQSLVEEELAAASDASRPPSSS